MPQTAPATLPWQTSTPVLPPDLEAVFHRLSLHSMRFTVVGVHAQNVAAVWNIDEHGQLSQEVGEHALERVFPGAPHMTGQLLHMAPKDTASQKLGPRQWAFAWRVDPMHCALVAVRYRNQYEIQGDSDTGLVRLLGETLLRALMPQLMPRPVAAAKAPAPMQAAAPTRHDAPAKAGSVALVVLLLCGLLMLGLSWFAMDKVKEQAAVAQAELNLAQDKADETTARNLAVILSTGEYGDVQAALSSLFPQSSLQGAIVTNAKQRIVALSGASGTLRIGDTVPAEVASTARVFELQHGSERRGQLFSLGLGPRTAAPSAAASGSAQWLLWGLAVLSLLLVLSSVLLLLLRKRWY